MRKKCVPKEGLEPSPGVKPDWILSPARLPIPPLRQIPLMVYQPGIFQRFQDVNILHESPSQSPEATKSTFTRLWWEFRHFGKFTFMVLSTWNLSEISRRKHTA